VSVSALQPAVEAGLIEVPDGELRFRHPLIRSAVRQAAEPGQLQATYAALATFVADPERRLWHRAMATDFPGPPRRTSKMNAHTDSIGVDASR